MALFPIIDSQSECHESIHSSNSRVLPLGNHAAFYMLSAFSKVNLVEIYTVSDRPSIMK